MLLIIGTMTTWARKSTVGMNRDDESLALNLQQREIGRRDRLASRAV